VIHYNESLPLDWVVIETWNDWNEGTEIEPSIEDGYQYLILTINNINAFKGTDIDEDRFKFEVAMKIYEASRLIENGSLDPILYQPILKKAVQEFLRREFDYSMQTVVSIINHID